MHLMRVYILWSWSYLMCFVLHVPRDVWHLRLLLHPFNDLFSRTTWVSRHQKGSTVLIMTGKSTLPTFCDKVIQTTISNQCSIKVKTGCSYGETWPVRKENEVALQWAELRMVRWMFDIKLQYTVPSKGLRERQGLDDIILVLQQITLRWYGHVLQKENNDWVKKCML